MGFVEKLYVGFILYCTIMYYHLGVVTEQWPSIIIKWGGSLRRQPLHAIRGRAPALRGIGAGKAGDGGVHPPLGPQLQLGVGRL